MLQVKMKDIISKCMNLEGMYSENDVAKLIFSGRITKTEKNVMSLVDILRGT